MRLQEAAWTRSRSSRSSGPTNRRPPARCSRGFRRGPTYRPDPKSRTAQEIAWQIVCEEKMIIDALESGKAEWAPPPMPATMKEVLDAYEKQSADIAARWARCLPRAGTARSSSSAAAGPRRRWPGAFSSTSSITADRSPRTCGRWDRRFRRSTGPAETSHSAFGRGSHVRPDARCARGARSATIPALLSGRPWRRGGLRRCELRPGADPWQP